MRARYVDHVVEVQLLVPGIAHALESGIDDREAAPADTLSVHIEEVDVSSMLELGTQISIDAVRSCIHV